MSESKTLDDHIKTDINDVAERERTEIAQEGKEQRRAILRTAMDGFWLLDMQGRLLDVNETYCRMSGYSVQELLAMRITDLDALETGDDTATHMQKVMAQSEDRFASRHRRKDGSVFDVEISVQYRPIGGGQFVGFLRDITERKRAEKEIESLSKFPAENPDSVLRIAEDGTILYSNKPGLGLLAGWGAEVGKKAPKRWCRLIKKKLDSGKPGLEEEEEEEEDKTFSIAIAPVKEAGYANLYARDISERKKSERALKESERRLKDLINKTTRSQGEIEASYSELKSSKDDLVRSEKLAFTGRIAASIAHEIRNPLTNVSVSVRQLKKSGRIKPEGFKHSEIIERNVERINFLITELLNCARPAKLNLNPYDIHRVIEDVLDSEKNKIKSQRVKMIKFLSVKPSILKIDKEHMGRALLNLVTNAVDAMPGGGKLIINTEVAKDFFLIKVRDTGRGIPDKDIIRIFDPFFSTKSQGVGLGLAICYGIIISHGGTIEVESKWRKGTTFIISLPVERAHTRGGDEVRVR